MWFILVQYLLTKNYSAFYFVKYSGSCIPESWVCDGVKDCDQGEDEDHCAAKLECRPEDHKFRCRQDGSCISLSFVCDGLRQCPDGSDETICETKDKHASEYLYVSYFSIKFYFVSILL